jgi:UDP-N-acetylglucosamine 2-epimerase (non-hydrolysing)
MKVLTLAGTRPELIRLCIIIEKLDKLVDHVFVYTNQNFDPNLSTIFFEELGIRHPNYYFNFKSGKPDYFLAEGFNEFSDVLDKEKPDKVLVLGDTNSGLLAMLAAKRGIPVYHMEAGNRCFDDRVPEETNRRIIDSFSKYNLPYTDNSKQNLLNEGYHKNYVFKTGNPILEVLNRFDKEIESSDVLERLGISLEEFVLVTAHRAENVDNETSLRDIVDALNQISNTYKVVFSVHPRTRTKLTGMTLSNNIILSEPFGLFDFVKMEKTARVTISDSGTVQEECCIFKVPSITIRRTTERQETIECGSNILVGTDTDTIIDAFNTILKRKSTWNPPEDYLVPNVSDTIINILLGR